MWIFSAKDFQMDGILVRLLVFIAAMFLSLQQVIAIRRISNVRSENYELWNKTLFKTPSNREVYWSMESSKVAKASVANALQAIADYTCLTFSEDIERVKDCTGGSLCVTVNDSSNLVLASSELTEKNDFLAGNSSNGLASALLSSLGTVRNINRKDRDRNIQIRFEHLRSDLLLTKKDAGQSLVSQLFFKCEKYPISTPFDYLSVMFDDIEALQDDEIPLVVPIDPANIWKLYVRIPNSPHLSIFDRYYATEKLCYEEESKQSIMARNSCDQQDCKYGFLQRECRCVCLPGFTGSECDQHAITSKESDILGVPTPNFPIKISSQIAWIRGGFEVQSSVTPSFHQFVWSCQMQASSRHRLKIGIYFSLLFSQLLKNPNYLDVMRFQLLYTHGSQLLYRSIYLTEHLPLVSFVPRARNVTLLLLVRGDLSSLKDIDSLTSLMTGSPIIGQLEPDPLFHLSLALNPVSQPVRLAYFKDASQLPVNVQATDHRGRMAKEDVSGTEHRPETTIEEKDGLQSYLPIALGVICAMWLILLAVTIFCYVRSDRRRPPAEDAPSASEAASSLHAVPVVPPTAEHDAGSTSTSTGSSTSAESTAATSAGLTSDASGDSTSGSELSTAAPTGEDDGSARVQFSEPVAEVLPAGIRKKIK